MGILSDVLGGSKVKRQRRQHKADAKQAEELRDRGILPGIYTDPHGSWKFGNQGGGAGWTFEGSEDWTDRYKGLIDEQRQITDWGRSVFDPKDPYSGINWDAIRGAAESDIFDINVKGADKTSDLFNKFGFGSNFMREQAQNFDLVESLKQKRRADAMGSQWRMFDNYLRLGGDQNKRIQDWIPRYGADFARQASDTITDYDIARWEDYKASRNQLAKLKDQEKSIWDRALMAGDFALGAYMGAGGDFGLSNFGGGGGGTSMFNPWEGGGMPMGSSPASYFDPNAAIWQPQGSSFSWPDINMTGLSNSYSYTPASYDIDSTDFANTDWSMWNFK